MSSVSRASSDLEELLAPYHLLWEIGSRPNPLYVVRQTAHGGKSKLLVAERFEGMVPGNGKEATFISEARRISTLASPNVGRLRELSVRGSDLVVFWDFIDGDRLEETWLSRDMSLEVTLRLILDVLAGASAIHGLRDAKQRPMQLVHGELSPATVVVGIDGAARVLHAVARRVPGAPAEPASRGYLAPEVHAGATPDMRADVFSAGVLLWEALGGARLFSNDDPAAIVARVQSGVRPPANADAAPWTKGLGQVAARALAFSPADRWPTAPAMAAEIRKAAGLRLASAAVASAFAKAAMGERVNARRARLESGVVGAPLPAAEIAPEPTAPDVESTSAAALAVPTPAAAPTPTPASPAAVDIDPDMDVQLLPESLPPSAAPERIAGPDAAPPPPLPARAMQPTRHAPVVDVPISVAPPPADSAEVLPTYVERAVIDRDTSRRRRTAVLGGVGALGLIVFSLAGWRVAHHAGERAGAPPPVAHAHTSKPQTPSALEAASARAPEAAPAAPPAARGTTAFTPTVAHAAASAKSSPSQAPTIGAAAKPSSPAAGAPRKSPPTPAAPPKAHASGFDPNSL